MDSPSNRADPLRSGSALGPFTIVARIGTGGMGQVYRARDSKLDRDVAVKVLLPEFASHPDRLARFQREARVLASLSHPRIAAIYGLEDADGTPALVMEFVDGATLADRVALGPLPLDDTLQIAAQLVDGLEYAHEQGIVHRDLKPANVKVAQDDSVKILDFGLAKALEGDGAAASPANSPTVTMATQAGVILGTAAYMAPEQARGKAVDRRADIWAFGCVLYEMLCGAPAFRGDTVADILAAVVHKEPDWARLPAATPPPLRDLLRRCLQKDVRQRLQAIGEARIALEEIRRGGGDARAPAAPRGRRFAWAPAVAGGVLGAAAATAFLWHSSSVQAPPPVTRFTITLPAGQTLAALDRTALALSDDGRQLAYIAATGSGTTQIYLRRLDATDATAVSGTEGAHLPFFSPDGQWLGFVADGQLKKVAVAGGAPQSLTSLANSHGAAWTDDHEIVFAPLASPLQIVADTGGAPRSLTRMLAGETLHEWPQRLPGGNVLFTAATARGQGFAVQPIARGDRKDVLSGLIGMSASYVPSGHLVFEQGGSLMALPFDLSRLAVRGTAPAVPVLKGVFEGYTAAQFTVSASGSLAYAPGESASSEHYLVWVGRDGTVQPLKAPSRPYYQPRLSPDGHKVAVDLSGDVSVYDIERDTLTPFTYGGTSRHGIWTADGQYLIFQSDRDGTQRIYWQPADGSGAPEPLMTETRPSSDGVFNIPYSASRGGVLTFTKLFPTKNAQLWSLQLPPEHGAGAGPRSGTDVHQFLEVSAADVAPQQSPDGHWLAYAADESGSGREIYVRAFPGPGGPWQVSNDGGNEPQWNPNGKELFYRSGRRMMAVSIDAASGFSAGKPHELFEGDFDTVIGGFVRANYDVSPDGQRFLMVQAKVQAPTAITVVMNWSEELKHLVPVTP